MSVAEQIRKFVSPLLEGGTTKLCWTRDRFYSPKATNNSGEYRNSSTRAGHGLDLVAELRLVPIVIIGFYYHCISFAEYILLYLARDPVAVQL